MTPDVKATVEEKTQPDGSVSVTINGRDHADVQQRIDAIYRKIERTNGTASFHGPLRVNFGYVAFGNYRIFDAKYLGEQYASYGKTRKPLA